jgi:hypothetical protein
MAPLRTTRIFSLGLLAVSSLTIACGDAASGDDENFAGTVRDSAGVRIVANAETGLWPEAGGWTTEEVLSIGEAAGDADYQFGQVGGIGVASDGRIAVLDQQAQRVQIYDADGTYLRSVGGPGNGPGELSGQTTGLFVGRGDTMIVADMGNARINVVPMDGEPTSFPIRLEDGIPLRFDMNDSGDLVAQRRSMNASAAGTEPTDLITLQTYDGTLTDTLLTPRRGESFELSGGAPSFKLFAAEPMWTMMGDDRIAYASNDVYRINVYDAYGALTQVVTRPHEARTVTEADRETVLGMVRQSMEKAGMPPENVSMMMNAVSFADTWPAFTQLRGGPDGTLWVQRLRYLDELSDEDRANWDPQLDNGSAEWDVYESDGRYGGVVTMPESFTPFVFDGDRIYGVFRDDFDVQYVRAYELSGDREFQDT